MELKLDRLTKQFGSAIAVDRVSVTFSPGVYGLLGANGAGKTTLMRMICDVLSPTSGQVLYDGQDISKLGEVYRNKLGYLPQDFGYYPDFSALDFMLYLAALKGFDRAHAKRRSLELLELVGLESVAKAKIKTFSGGMKQRLGIAQAVINEPEVLVLDEPTAGLDPKERVRFRNLISGFSQDKIVILSTHIVSDVEYIADDIFLMKSGAIMHSGSPEEVVRQIEGKVWECRTDPRGADSMATKYTIGNIHYDSDGLAVLRIVSDLPPTNDARPLLPTLEDLYLYLFSDQIDYGSPLPKRKSALQGDPQPEAKGGRDA
ncbi:ABC transporter ATP-binding protein [Raoultibacter phocaeensis]|uniref:ABC transporter ATP-binding protein n=1 Tax=Raoultibacter phocaeensis TaxID=2479841 RepID=UPI00111845BB|nr:ABC transporter ATP-binding protein [Raoultibacter phocaeensis]